LLISVLASLGCAVSASAPAVAAPPEVLNPGWKQVATASFGGAQVKRVGSTIWAVSWQGDVRRSTDNGATWTQAAPTDPWPALAVDPTDSDIAYVGTSGSGVYKTVDGGAHWTFANDGFDLHPSPDAVLPQRITGIAIDPGDTTTLYASVMMGVDSDQVYRSTDSGGHWTPVLAGNWAESVAVAPDGTVVAGAGAGVVVSTDGGSTWSEPSGPGLSEVALDPANASTIYAVSSDGAEAAVSTDGGSTWAPLDAGHPSFVSDVEVGSDGTVYIAGDNGLSWSVDGGESWKQSMLDNGSGDVTPSAVLPDLATGVALVGSSAAGLWTVDLAAAPEGTRSYYSTGTLPATEVTPTSAVLNGVTAATWPFSTPGFWYFSWGTASPFPHALAGSTSFELDNAEHEVSAQLTGLTPNTTYHVRLDSTDSALWLDPVARPDDVTFTTPPAVSPRTSMPNSRIAAGQIVGGDVPVNVGWTVEPGTYPVCHSTVRQSIGHGSYLPTGVQPVHAARSVLLRLTPRPEYRRFEVRAEDCHGTPSTWGMAPGTRLFGVPDGAATRTRGWHRTTGSKLWGGGAISTTVPGATARFRVTAHSVGLVASRMRGGGLARIYLDGDLAATVNLHASSAQQRRIVFTHSWPAGGQHWVKIVAGRSSTGSTVTVDGLAGLS
jgi:photosystem II stability/assembly factor-like uncharacterized protein